MEANQVETTQSVCPKCGKSVQSDFTRCPYCGAKLQVDPNDKVEKVKQGFFNFLSKAKDFFISAGKTIGKLAMSHKKITIAVSAVLILLIVLIPIITTFTNPLHPNNVAKVDVGVLTEQDVTKTYGQPSNVINAYSIQGISLGAAQGMCREAWVYYDDAFAKKLKAFEEKFNNAESFEDLDKLDKEYNKLTKEKFDCLVVGFDMDGNVSFVCLNKNAKYDELDVFASKQPKELKEVQLTKNTLCRGSSVAASNISYIAKYKDGSVVKAKITTNGTTNEEQTATKINIQSIFGEYSVNLKMVDHVFDSNCLCKNCGKEHNLDENCRCVLCDRTFHDMQGCECKNCDYNTHTPGSDCKCTICNQTVHSLDKNCVCTQCGIVAHKYDEDQVCIHCHADKQGLKYTLCSGTDEQGNDIQYYAVAYSPNATGTVVIPSTHQGIPVLAINAEAFRGCTSLTSITVPDSVMRIGWGAFKDCSGLTSITIPFVGTEKDGGYFESIFIGANDRYVVVPSSLKTVTITGGTSIVDRAFLGCDSLTSITLPNSVTSIGEYAFDGCSSLTSITIPNSVTSIGHGAFWGCSSLTSITIPDGVSSIDGTFSGCSSLTSITIPDSVTSIGAYEFCGCSSLTSITIPNSVTSIRNYAFSNCSSLTSIIFLGNSVTSIGGWVFEDCSRLTSVYVDDIAKLCCDGINSSDLFSASPTIYLNGNTLSGDIVIGYGAEYVPSGIFSGNTSITSVTIPDSVTSIEEYAFSGCSSLTSITISNSVTRIGDGAFRNCSSLTNITIPDNVTSIGEKAFYNCTSLTSINIPDSVTSIGNSAFYGCSSLTSITIPDSVTSIERRTFLGCTSLTSITIPDGVTSIGSGTFSGCTSLTSITIPDSVTSIGEYAFSDCSSLTSIAIPDSVTSIGECAFWECYGLTSINIPDSVTSIGYNAFGYCRSLTRVDITDIAKWFDISFGNLVANPLSDAHKLYLNGELVTNLVIPDSVTSIGSSAFYSCSSLTSITIPDSVTSIGGSAFQGCGSLTEITIPDSVTRIGSYAFYDCDIKITFQGTKAQWNAISKGEHWYYHLGLSNFTINCTDGTIKVYC